MKKAIILAAGKGSRLGKYTQGLPKSFLEVNGKKIIAHQIDSLRKIGVKEIIIVTGYKSELFQREFSESEDIKLVCNPFYEKCNVLGSLWFAREHINSGFLFYTDIKQYNQTKQNPIPSKNSQRSFLEKLQKPLNNKITNNKRDKHSNHKHINFTSCNYVKTYTKQLFNPSTEDNWYT